MGLSKMLSELWLNLQSMLRPYSLEDFIRDYDPKDVHEVERLEKIWHKLHSDRGYWY